MCPQLLQLVRHLRRQGYFVAAALTRPFEFEGSRRLEAADALITTLEEVAHLVVRRAGGRHGVEGPGIGRADPGGQTQGGQQGLQACCEAWKVAHLVVRGAELCAEEREGAGQ